MNYRYRNVNELKRICLELSTPNLDPCVYCGLPAQDDEHVIPQAWMNELKDLQQQGIIKKLPEQSIVRACRECNLIATDNVFKSFRSKRVFIREELERKYNKLAKTPLWEDAEINELDGHLREQVFWHNELVKLMKKRLASFRA